MPFNPSVSIIILTYNNLELTRQCLESIFTRTTQPAYELILVDNASTDSTPEFLRECTEKSRDEQYRRRSPTPLTGIHLILNDQNKGFAAGINQGVKAASGEYLVFLNNDTVVTDGWLAGLVRPLQDPQVGMVGPVTNEIGNESCIAVDYQNLEEMPEFAQRYTLAHQGQKFETQVLAFFCAVLRHQVYQEIGPLDEQFDVGMFEDDDYALRLKEHGYRLICAEDVFVHHHGGASFSALGLTRYWYLFDQNRKKFESKWGIEWQPHLKRPELIRQQIRQLIDSASWYVSLITEERQQRENAQLAQWNAELAQKTAELAQKNAELALAAVYASRSWRLARLFQLVKLPFTPMIRWLNSVAEILARKQMSWYAYYFDRYKRTRDSIYPHNPKPLSTLFTYDESKNAGLVSIVLPIYNGAAYLTEALESILNQTYTNFELIIIDDGSTDATPEILAEYAARDQRIRLFHQQNQRLPSALSAGFRQARGEYLTWTSADNRLKAVFLEKMVSCLRRYPDWDLIYANQDIIGEDGKPLPGSDWFLHYQCPPGSEHIRLPADPSELNVYPNNYVGAAFLYRRHVAALIGNYSPWRFGTEDYDYWMRVNSLMNLRHVDFEDAVYEYRFHSASLTSRDDELGITSRRVRLMVFDDFRRDFCLTPLIWWIEVDDDIHSQQLSLELRRQVLQVGHLLFEKAVPDAVKLPGFTVPIVHLKFVTKVDALAGDKTGFLPGNTTDRARAIPPWAMKALVCCTDQSLPDQVHQDWDIVIRSQTGNNIITSATAIFEAIEIRTRSHHFSQAEALAEQLTVPQFKASVVICTYHRGVLLEESLRSVVSQTFPAEDYEIIVINNDPADWSVDQLVTELNKEARPHNTQQLKIYHCPLKGLSFARNAGIAAASGQIICFLDDDATAQPDWLDQIWRTFQKNPQAGVVGGAIRLHIPDPRPPALKPGWEKYWSQFLPGYSEATAIAHWWEFPWGANWCASRKALLEIGGFRNRYGRRGADFGGGEEIVAATLIQKLGYSIIINPLAVVTHKPEASRFTQKHVKQTIQAGKINQYLEQIDLYLPMQYGLRIFVYNQVIYLKSLLRPKQRPYQRIEYVWYSWVEFKTIMWWLRDRLARFKKPVSMRT